jgi:hypothetical protein
MSGILDSKSRIIDAILTTEGRRQMAEDTFEISYATFTDAGVSYVTDKIDGHQDPTVKIMFEACNLPQDQITFEANDEGKLVSLRRQDIKLKTPNGNVPSGYAEGTLTNGRLTVYQYHHGRRIKTSFIQEITSDVNKGFVYSDSTGLTGSILAKPNLKAGQVSATAPMLGKPYVAYFGTQGGMGPQQFAQTLSGAIAALKTLGGPDVNGSAVNDSVYLDVGETFIGTKLYASGTLSSPLVLEEGAIGGKVMVDELQNSSFASQIEGILTSSFDNFVELQTISTIDRLFEDDQFFLSETVVNFDMSKLDPIVMKALKESPPSLNSIDSLFNDDKLSHLENHMYLPPIIKTPDALVTDKTLLDNTLPHLLGDYPSWGDNENKLTYKKLLSQLDPYKDVKQEVYFNKTSRNNEIIAQFFEVTDKEVSKLDVVDFGVVMNDDRSSSVVTNKVFFVGKTFLDNRGTTCFVNMFTLIFSKDDRQESETLT